MQITSHVIAMIFDFDETLTNDSTSALLTKYQVDAPNFWKNDHDRLVKEGWDSTCAWLHLFLRLMEDGKLPKLTNRELTEFGKTLEPYPGLGTFFDDLNKLAREESTATEMFQVEFYIISGGLQDVIEGFHLRHRFSAVWGSQLASDQQEGPLKYVKRALTFTEKTKYLFEINKGLDQREAVKNPYLVNRKIDEKNRRVPFENMIYVGDGLSDIPCFSLIEKMSNGKGRSVGVFRPGEAPSAKRAWLELLVPRRVASAHAPFYDADRELGAVLRLAVQARCSIIKLEKGSATV
ncbi:MAG TPA: haloacid dehalogenase-like hydrolase [Candidatus Acidoferrum sp.]|nr:haloacid dehalogenase-like hydrolase [Candidatus Acidoferrum sp.]